MDKRSSMPVVAYYRVSTKQQGRSGLSLEAQREDVRRWAGDRLIAEYTEIESGAKADRVELEKAISKAVTRGAVLCTAKFDRLSRDGEHAHKLMKTGLNFMFLDWPDLSDPLMLAVAIGFSQREREAISARTKRVWQVEKDRFMRTGKTKRGKTTLGRPNGWEGVSKELLAEGRVKGTKAYSMKRRAHAEHYRDAMQTVAGMSANEAAKVLTASGEVTPRESKVWSAKQVIRLRDMLQL